MNILVIDVGTSSMRGILYNQDAEVVFIHRVLYNVNYLGEDLAEQDPGDWENALCQICFKSVEYCKENTLTINGLSLTSQRSSIIPVDKAGCPLRQAIMWLDKRNKEICENLKPYEEKIVSLSGARINTVFSGSKMTWLKRNEREVYDKSYKIMTIADYLVFLMTGEYNTDHTYGSRSLLMNIQTRQWDENLMELFEIDRGKLCDLLSPGDVSGYVKQTFANKTGLMPGIPVVSAGGDQQCAALGMGVINTGDMELTAGTGAFLLAYSDHIPKNLKDNIICGAHAIKGKYVLESSILSCSSLYDWMRENLYDIEILERDNYEKINSEIKSAPVGSNGCIALPFFQGRGTPDWNSHATGCFANLTLNTTRKDMARAMLESIAYEVDNNIEILEGYSGKATQLIISGGLTKFREFNQIQADVYQKKLLQSKDAEQTSIGAWVSAAVTLKMFDSYKTALKCAKKEDKMIAYSPNIQNHKIYQKQKMLMNEIYQKLSHTY